MKNEEELKRELNDLTLEQVREQTERFREAQRTINTSMFEAGKALAVLNGGSVATLLGFTQALIKNNHFVAIKYSILWALGCFLVGAILAVLVPFFQAVERMMYITEHGRLDWGRAWIIIGVVGSATLFCSGAFTMIIGIMRAF
ncbi:hypothetical protein [Noviherbaspirillum humi]|uniref:hypothetical protein n=1 Tax=Noviherbaspirillum humi TaxID=1688639 RepID=UPI000B76E7EB|nr:hypothetical protein [Noviherbaspirillum humi]